MQFNFSISIMVCCKTEKVFVFTCLWVLWSTSGSIHVKAVYDDTLKPGDTLDATSSLYSEQGKFSLFFTRTFANEDTHLVIRAVNENVVWMAYRNQSIDPDFAVLSLNHSGVLKIESNGKTMILYSPPQPANNTVATLLDTGNFVLQQVHPNGTKSTVLWQSFDYPTDTLIPTMKLGVNRKTGHNWSLVSSLTTSISAPGALSLEWEPKARELIIKQRGKVYWKSGKLRNNGLFENIPEDIQSMYQYTIVSNSDEDSFTFKIKTSQNKDGKFQGWKLLPTGQLTKPNVGGDIARTDICYGYNRDGGCQRWEDIPTCREPGDVFQEKMGSPNSVDNATIQLNTSYGYSDCKEICWRKCYCTGFKEYYRNGTGCAFFFWNSSKNFVVGDNGLFYILVKPVPVSPHGQPPRQFFDRPADYPGKKKWIWISAIIAAALLITCPPILCLAIKKIKYGLKEKKSKRRETEMLNLAASDESSVIKHLEDDLKGHDIKVFSYASILAATTGFSLENKLGQGGYGPVYKGILPTGQEVAVKRLSKASGQGIIEFKNELTLICELQHTNLVQLLGCCIHEEERILIYEYMPNKSLDFYLFDCTRRNLLDWKKRLNIIEGISQGLLYLHKYSRLKIIHRDLKASNILLDENMCPKISDFGMARMFTQQESTINTDRIVGTYGYMSPEYAMEGVYSTKSDVYSYGVLLLEIVSGRRNNSFYCEDRPLTIIGYAWELWKDGECLKLMDPSLNDTFISDEVQRCIHVGLLCVEQYANDRPTMSDIISMLTNKNALVTLPRRPAFYVGREIHEGTTTSKVSETCFTKEISTSSEVE